MIPADAAVIADNDQVRITRWTFAAPGATTGLHHHELSYVVVPVTGGTFTVTDADGTTQSMDQTAGVPYLRPAGAVHNVASTGSTETVFVEIELKN